MVSSPGQHRSPGHPVDAAVIDQGVCSSVTSGGRRLGGLLEVVLLDPDALRRLVWALVCRRCRSVPTGTCSDNSLPEQVCTTGVFFLCACNSRAVENALSTDGDVPRQAAAWWTTKPSSHFFNIWTWCFRRRGVAMNSSGWVG